ncbi:MAG: hypothetical protein A2Y62_02160 [Candidatus Fischerbacteria bacterium RBG_13_37_8]|uniref:Uncharacterized protein n=1 Tax=Candidatus Fischerbacteria bacterium RBG_13_37_8 TaxID=1817863 RepID=A0A1F5VJR6_9BACT|nr:MAG: hypothetical protein A2Y62_02160 [Candidatus Fischerbacteria bacterium RBG_13_37_8]
MILKETLTADWLGITTFIRSGHVLYITDIERTILDVLKNPELAGGIDELLFSLEGLRGSSILTAPVQASSAIVLLLRPA